MNERIKKLREESLNAIPYISPERAVLITKFYKSDVANKVSQPLRRAMALKYMLENKKLCLNDGELIVGERGPEPKAVPTYPEIIVHSIDDLEILNSREKVWYRVDEETKRIYSEEIIPFWKGRAVRDKIFNEVDEDWINAYKAGIFTEFMEQRAPGHTVLDDKIYKKGFKDFIKDIEENIKKLDFYNDPEALKKREELKAMKVAAEALISYAKRYSKLLREKAEGETDPERRKELFEMAEICKRVPENKPSTF